MCTIDLSLGPHPCLSKSYTVQAKVRNLFAPGTGLHAEQQPNMSPPPGTIINDHPVVVRFAESLGQTELETRARDRETRIGPVRAVNENGIGRRDNQG